MTPRIFSVLLALAVLCAGPGAARGASPSPSATEWQPAHTWVFYASICSWPAKAGLASFTGTRRDEDFVAQFKAAGVPGKNVVFLKDSAATHAAMRDGLAALAARAGAGPDDTLVFAFQGHGSRKLLFCYDYDAARPDETVFHMDEIFPILDKSWKGRRLILIGDCCCSGSLRSVLAQFARQRPEVRVAALASATASNLSTGNWTFTEGLIRALRGDPIIDRDHDGRLSISEVDRFIHDQMKYKEDQLASLTLSANFEKDFVLRAAASGPAAAVRDVPGAYQIGDVLEARDQEGKWYPSEILDWKQAGNSYRVHFAGWDDKWDEWVDAARLRPITKPKLNVGQHYEVKWQGKWYPATLTKSVEDYFYFVHYENEAGEDDEWITPERARAARPEGGKPQPAAAATSFVALDARPPAVGDLVAAQYHTDWYSGRITGLVNGTFAVRYDDNTTGKLVASQLIPVADPATLRVGDRVLAVWSNDARMYPGRVKAIDGPKARIKWEDGSAPSDVPLKAIARIRQ